MTDRFSKLVELLGAPEDITVEQLYKEIDEENSANVAITRENHRLSLWLDKISRLSRGKGRGWAKLALAGNDINDD